MSVPRKISTTKTSNLVLKLGTYLVPSIPVEYFENLLDYIEVRLGCEATLMYESRWEYSPTHRRNPFADDSLDLAFMTRSAYVELVARGVPVELLPISPVSQHPRAEDRPGRFVDIVCNQSVMQTAKDMLDLRGCRWARTVNDNITSLMTLSQLKTMGENAHFFGNVLVANSYLEVLNMLVSRKAHAAAVDSDVLASFLKNNPQHRNGLHILTSWGRLPPFAIVVRKGLSIEYKGRITDTLLNMYYDPQGARILREFNIRRFARTETDEFKQEKELAENTRTLTFEAIYY
ncbi:hypothetical protein HDE_07151 [Halotydeus destructor]|nr:hypothetical protein HDE_07151 [Halotydeus destructor]